MNLDSVLRREEVERHILVIPVNPHALLGHNEGLESPPPLPPPSMGRSKGEGHFHIKS